MDSSLRSLLAEPEIGDPPPVGWIDRLLVACVLLGVALEALFRPDMVFKPVALAAFAALAFVLLIRRTKPLLAVGLVIGTLSVFDIVATASGREPVEVYSAAFVLVLVYSVFRWGSGRQALGALGFMALITTVIQFTDFTSVGDLIGGTIVFLLPAAIGLVVRYQRSVREQQVHQIKSHEREQLARDLHDTVAHHVSAIAVQAQVGQVLGQSSPDAAIKALAVIEAEAGQTLAEMRTIVEALRGDDEVTHVPQQGIADIESLASTASTTGLRVDVTTDGDIGTVSPSLGAGVYRLAQESITNASRHARNATVVQVKITAGANDIKLAVTDDGDRVTQSTTDVGWGLIGMTERAELLGGTLRAGPRPAGGWEVHAVLPRAAS